MVISQENYNIYALTRDPNKIIQEFKNKKICVIKGDVTQKNLGLNESDSRKLETEVDVIFHGAAITDLNIPISELRKTNVNGTKNMLDFTQNCKKNGRLKKLNHISTAYVAGDMGKHNCTIYEDNIKLGQGFNNNYERSKYEGEQLIADYRNRGLEIDVFRPSIILGRFGDGVTTNFKMLYQPLHFFSLGLFDRLPKPEFKVGNLINVDIAARSIVQISKKATRRNVNYHIVSPNTVSLDYILTIASDYFGFKKPEFTIAKDFDFANEYTPAARKIIEPYMSYFNYGANFDMANTLSKLPDAEKSFPQFDKKNLTRLFEYCDKTGFIRRKKRFYAS